jgi:hypothetical protein
MVEVRYIIANNVIPSVLLFLLSSIVFAAEPTEGHPALGLKSGESRLVGGVLYSYDVAPESRRAFVPGLPEKFQAGLSKNLALIRSKTAAAKEKVRASAAISDSWIRYWTEPLPPAKQAVVKDAYEQAGKATTLVRADLAKKRITKDAAVSRLAIIAADLALSEAEAFAGVPDAQKRRYRSWRGQSAPDKDKLRADLVTAYQAFFSGDYIAMDQEEIARTQKAWPLPGRAELHPEIMAIERPQSLLSWIFCGRYPQRQFVRCSVETLPQAATSKWGYAVFLAEHPVTDGSIPPYLGPYHTSVLAGLYKLTTRPTIIKVTHTNMGQSPSQTVKWYKSVVTSEIFQEWLMGNGSGSWVKENDSFHPFPQPDGTTKAFAKVAYFDTEAQARAQAVTPVGSDPIDACSYSVGDYSTDWVCHQNSNCFAWKMWGIQWLVNYPTNAMYGNAGGTGGANGYAAFNLGCAPRIDADGGSHNEGGVPGSGQLLDRLYYQITEPYIENKYVAALVQEQSTGQGLGLNSERCRFNPASVPANIVGPNYTWSTLDEIEQP